MTKRPSRPPTAHISREIRAAAEARRAIAEADLAELEAERIAAAVAAAESFHARANETTCGQAEGPHGSFNAGDAERPTEPPP